MFDEPSTLDDLGILCIKVINLNVRKSTRVVGFAWEVTYADRISNTHSCPVDGEQNFMCKQDKPRGYPGYQGRVWIRYAGKLDDFGCSPFTKTLTHTGSGGGGTYNGPWTNLSNILYHKGKKSYYEHLNCFSWEYKIFEDDWPLIKQNRQEENIIAVLSGKEVNKKHKFIWEDPQISIMDKEIIDNYNKKD